LVENCRRKMWRQESGAHTVDTPTSEPVTLISIADTPKFGVDTVLAGEVTVCERECLQKSQAPGRAARHYAAFTPRNHSAGIANCRTNCRGTGLSRVVC
jgi:hypothetical protein